MTQLLVMIIIGLGIAAVAAGGAVTLYQAGKHGYEQQLLFARMEQTVALLKANMIIHDGLPALIAPSNHTDNYPIVPETLTNAGIDLNGNPFTYCPFALRAASSGLEGTAQTVTGPGYSVVLDSTSVSNGVFVIGAERPSFSGTPSAAPQGLLGLLIAFPPGVDYSSTVAANWCATNNISVSSTGVISASASSVAGLVYPIIVPQSFQQQAFAKQETITLYAAASATGDRTGRDGDNYTTLDAAFAQLATLRPHRAKIFLAAGTHSLSAVNKTDSGGNEIYNVGNLRQINYEIQGADKSTTTITLSTNYNLPINTYWRDVTVSPSGSETITVGPNSKMVIDDSIISNLVVYKGDAWVTGTSAINTSLQVQDLGRLMVKGTLTSSVPDQGIVILPGQVNILPSATWTVTATSTSASPSAPIIIRGGGKLSISGTMNVTSNGSTQLASAINSIPGSYIYMNNSTLSIDSGNSTIAGDGSDRPGAIVLGGEMYMINSGLEFPNGTSSGVAGVVLVDGGQFYMHSDSYIGDSGDSNARPDIGVYDNGGSAVGGSSAGCGNTGAAEPADGNTTCDTGDGGSPVSNVYAVNSCWGGNGDPHGLGIATARQRHLFLDSDDGDGNYSYPKDSSADATYGDMRHLRLVNNTDWYCNGASGGGDGGCGEPSAYSFTDLTNQNLNCLLESNTITISGQSCAVSISISGGTTPAYRINGGSWTSAPGTISSGDTLQLRNTSSGSNSTTVNTTVTIGTTPDTWSITTGALAADCGGGGAVE